MKRKFRVKPGRPKTLIHAKYVTYILGEGERDKVYRQSQALGISQSAYIRLVIRKYR